MTPGTKVVVWYGVGKTVGTFTGKWDGRFHVRLDNGGPSVGFKRMRDLKPLAAQRSNPCKTGKRNAGGTASHTATRTATSTKATTTGNKTGTSTGGAVSGGGGNITVSVKRNPPKGFIPCSAVKITRNRGRVEVRVRR